MDREFDRGKSLRAASGGGLLPSMKPSNLLLAPRPVGLLRLLLLIGMVSGTPLAWAQRSFHVYAPSSLSGKLLVVEATPGKEGLALKLTEEINWDFRCPPPERRNGIAAKGHKERKARLLAGEPTELQFSRCHPSLARLLCVLCALSRLNFGIRAEANDAFTPELSSYFGVRVKFSPHAWGWSAGRQEADGSDGVQRFSG